MKKALLKDSLREIKNTFSRFMAILAIVAISVAFFAGIKITCPDMKNTADNYYDTYRLMDFKLLSTVGFNDEDIAELRRIPQVEGVLPSYTVDAVLDAKDSNSVVRIHALQSPSTRNGDEYINRPMLLSGRLPENSGECVVEKSGFFSANLDVESTIKLMSGKEGKALEELKSDTFTVVGIVKSPLYISKDRGTSTIGTGKIASYIFIGADDFDIPVYNTVYLTVKGARQEKTYSTEYDKIIEPVQSALDILAITRAKTRSDEIRTEANRILEEKRAEYNTAVTETAGKLADAEKIITDGEKKTADGKTALNKAIASFQQTITDSTSKLDAGDKQLAAGLADYTAKYNQFIAQRDLAIQAGQYEAMKQIFLDTENQLKIAKDQLDATAKDLALKRTELEAGNISAKKEFAQQKDKLDKAQADLVKARTELASNTLEANSKLADGKIELDKAQDTINKLPEVKWHVLDRNTNAGYVDYSGAADRMDAIAQVFPLIFILVGILICFTAMGRMVDEQRSYIGTAKALGYSKADIAGKYLIYASLASIIGGTIGVFIGFSFFPSFIFKAFTALYTLPPLILTFDVPFAAASIGVSTGVTVFAALFVCFEELQGSAAALMRPKAPKPGKIILLERITFLWKRMRFTQKVTARNLLRYKSRFFMTVTGVAGCTALLLVGFALKDSIGDIGIKQFNDIYTYQMIVNIKENITDVELSKINETIKTSDKYTASQLSMSKSITLSRGEVKKDCGLMVPEDTATLPQFISLHDRITKKVISLTGEGVVLTEKIARTLGAGIGDTVFIQINDYDKVSVKVTGICENYLNHYMFMTSTLYQKVYNAVPSYNSIYVKMDSARTQDEEAISKQVLTQDGVAAVYITSDMLSRFKDTIKSVDYVVLILIISAGLLSFIVLYTLTNININERMREIATIKVLGFYDREVSAYVFKENVILTLIGSLAGLVLGFYLSAFVIQTAEVDVIMFGRQISPFSFIMSCLMTIVFALFVNVVMLRKIRRINMVEALKTVE